MVFSMMPKPFANQPGSGMHFHVSLWQGRCDAGRPRRPTIPGAVDDRLLSPLGRQFMAGVLAHAPALCALAAPTVNSYKRLTVGESLSGTSWAPAYVAHGPTTAPPCCARCRAASNGGCPTPAPTPTWPPPA
jgi:glutamine synthetase